LRGEPDSLEAGAEVIGFREIRSIIRADLRNILLLTLFAGIVAAVWVGLKPNLYRSSASIAPLAEEAKPSAALGALASFGLPVGGSTKLEELEALFRSNDLTARVFKNHGPWAVVFGRDYDAKTGELRVGFRDRILFGRKKLEVPTDWDAIRAAGRSFTVSVNKKVGTLNVVYETLTPEGAAQIVGYYLDEARSRLQEEALQRATKNKKFLEDQIARSADPVSRDRLYTMYSQEIEREMMARNREQFGFRVVDAPRIPDRKSGPERAWSITVVLILAFLAGCAFSLVRHRKN